MNFIQKKDSISIVIFMLIFLSCIYITREAYESILVEVIAGGFGGLVGFLIANYAASKTKVLKYAILGIVLIFSVLGMYLVSFNHTDSKLFSGVYKTDSSNGIIIKLRIEENKAFLSMSPKYEEIEYMTELRNDSLYFYKDGEIRLEWELNKIDSETIIVSHESEKLKFTKEEL